MRILAFLLITFSSPLAAKEDSSIESYTRAGSCFKVVNCKCSTWKGIPGTVLKQKPCFKKPGGDPALAGQGFCSHRPSAGSEANRNGKSASIYFFDAQNSLADGNVTNESFRKYGERHFLSEQIHGFDAIDLPIQGEKDSRKFSNQFSFSRGSFKDLKKTEKSEEYSSDGEKMILRKKGKTYLAEKGVTLHEFEYEMSFQKKKGGGFLLQSQTVVHGTDRLSNDDRSFLDGLPDAHLYPEETTPKATLRSTFSCDVEFSGWKSPEGESVEDSSEPGTDTSGTKPAF